LAIWSLLRLILTHTRTSKKKQFADFHGPWAPRESSGVRVGGSCRYCWVLPQCFVITFRSDVTLSRAACIVASSIFAVLAFSSGILPLVRWSVHSLGRRCVVVPGARPLRFIISMPSAPPSVFAGAVPFFVLLLSFCVRLDRPSRRTGILFFLI